MERPGGDRLVSGALALTLGADTFLLVLNTRYVLGVLLFCGVRLLYFLRIYRWNGRQSWWELRLGLFQYAWMLPAAAGFARVGMWMFYLPAQVLFTLSGLPNFLTRGVPIENQ